MKAVEYFNQGYSCSESIVMEAIEKGLVPKELLPVATSFSPQATNASASTSAIKIASNFFIDKTSLQKISC